MKGIERITIQNFKAFRQKKTFHLKGKHLLVYGNNGSGKSSLYFALYTMLQSEAKEKENIEKYFIHANDENLLNVYERKNKPSFIKLVLTDRKNKQYTLSKNGLSPDNPKRRVTLKEMNLASEFISHRLLINFYNFRNSNEIDLYPVFDRDIFPFVQRDTGAKILFEEIIKDLKKRGHSGLRTKKQFKQWESDLTTLNIELERLIIYINNNATTFLHKYFHYKELKIILSLKKGFDYRKIGSSTKYELLPPFIKLSIQQLKPKKKDVDRPQSFLNEARLTAIALSIRFTILQKRPSIPEIKILALDDLLISLDMSNRMDVLKIIFDLYEQDYQLFFFTHDKAFYNEIKRWTKDKDTSWNYVVFKDPVNNIIKTENDKDDIERAKQFLKDSDFDSCALAIRKSIENSVKDFLMKQNQYQHEKFIAITNQIHTAQKIILNKSIIDFKRIIASFDLPHDILKKFPPPNNSDIDALGITLVQKQKLKGIRSSLTKLIIEHHKEHLEIVKLLDDAEQYVSRALNLGAHFTVAPLYKRELDNALVIVEDLKTKLKDLEL